MNKKTTSIRILALTSYLLFFFGIAPLIIWLLNKDEKFIAYHAKHSAILFYLWLIGNILASLLSAKIGSTYPRAVVDMVFLCSWILGMVYSWTGKEKSFT
jgi:uncharacterized membrane protein